MLLIWLFTGFGFQSDASDTLALDQVEVIAPAYQDYGQGQKINAWSKADLQIFSSRSLADLLAEQSPLFIRQYGPGMLSSPSFRGTSAGHTALYWNGLPINSPSLGQSDLSLLPVFAMDQAELQFGSAGALIGNESIGGSIQLSSGARFLAKPELTISQEIGSFGEFNSRVKGAFSTEKVAFQTKLYRLFAENDYPYADLAQAGAPIRHQDHARAEQLGLVQDFSWKTSSNQLLKTSFWYHQADREIQPPMGSSTQDIQIDESFRWSMDYEIFKDWGFVVFKTGWVQDKLTFNETVNQTRQFFVGTEGDFELGEKWNLHGGGRLSEIRGDLSTYSATDRRIEFFESLRFQPKENLIFSLNGRQLFFKDQTQPLVPSAGMDWDFFKSTKSIFSLKTSISRGFKVPTLNDRFWEPGGNPDLLPEESWSAETGLHWKQSTFSQSITAYWMDVDNWIIWLPNGSVWSPENIRQVRSTGLEYQGRVHFATGQINWKAEGQYSFNHAVSLIGISDSDASVGKQLPYTPQHQSNLKLSGEKKGLQISLTGDFTGKTTVTADNPRTMDPYFLLHGAISYPHLRIGTARLPVQFRVQNILNTSYQVLYLRPMPGISYHFNLSIQL